MSHSAFLWDRAVLKTIAIRERLSVEANPMKRNYLKQKLKRAKELESELEALFLDAVRDGRAEPIRRRREPAKKPKPAEHHRRQFYLSYLAMNNTKRQRLFRRFKLTGSNQTAEKLWEAAR